MTVEDPRLTHPFFIEREVGDEFYETAGLKAAREIAKYLLREGEEEGTLYIRPMGEEHPVARAEWASEHKRSVVIYGGSTERQWDGR